MANEVGVAYVALMPSMDKFNKAVRQAIKDNMGQFSKAVDSAGGGATSSLEKTAQKLASTGGSAGKDAGDKLGGGFIAALKSAMSETKVGGAVSGAVSAVKGLVGEIAKANPWAAVGIEGAKALASGLYKGSSLVVKAGASIYSETLKQFANIGGQIGNQIYNGVKSAYSKVGGLMANIGGSQLTNAAKNLGINIGGGITSGLSTAKLAVGSMLGGLLNTAVSTVSNSVSSAIGRVDTMANFPKIMSNMGIGAEESKKAINQLSEAIDGLPTSLDAAALGTQRLVAKNGDLDKSAKYFTALNNAIISGGASAEIQSSAVEQLTQSYSKGQMDMMEWRSLQMAMPAQLNQVAKAMGLTTEQLGAGLRKAEKSAEYLRDVSMDEFMDTLVRLNEEGGEGFASFAEQAKTSSKTIGTALTNFQNRVNKAMASVIDWVGQETIFDAIESITTKFGPMANSLVEFLDKIEAKRYIGEMFGAVGDAVGKISEKAAPLKTSLAPLLEGALPKALEVTKSTLDTIIDRAGPFIERVSGFVSEIPDMAGNLQPIIDAFVNLKFDTWEAALTMWQKVVEAVAPVMPQILQAQAQVNTTLAETIGNLAGTVAPIVADLATTVSNMIATAGPFVERLVTALAPVFTTIYTQIEGIYNKVIEAASQGTIIEDSAASLDSIMATVGETVGNILAALVPHIPTILDMADRIVTALAPAVEKIFTVLEPYIDPLLDLFAGAAEKLTPAIAECFEILAPHIPDLMEFVGKVIDLIADNLPGVAGIVGGILDVVSPLFNDVLDIAQNLLPVIIDLVGTLTDALQWLYDHTLGPILDVVKDITDFINDPSWEKFSGQFTGNTSVPSTRPMAEGGIATKPTRALIAEAGTPEAVVPLSAQGIQKFTSGLAPQYTSGGAPTVNIEIGNFINNDTSRDVRSLSEEIGRDTLRQLKQQGVYA